MNTACIIVTTYNLFDHYHDPRNNKGNANYNTIKKHHPRFFDNYNNFIQTVYKNKHRIQFKADQLHSLKKSAFCLKTS